MYIATIDCGTTNSRVYIVDEYGCVHAKATREVGVRDTAMSGSRDKLVDGLLACFHEALESADLHLGDVSMVLSSGMITSEIGLMDIPHLTAPVSVDDLAANLVRVVDPQVFPLDIPCYFVRGIKNPLPNGRSEHAQVGLLDFMRGEETQAVGLLAVDAAHCPVTMVMLSSHTKFVPIGVDGSILGSITTLSGQTYAAVKRETFIGKSIVPSSDQPSGYFDAAVVDNALSWCNKTGFIRALMMVRFLDTLLDSPWYERELFMEAVIAAEDMKTLGVFDQLGFNQRNPYVLIGNARRCAVYEYVLRRVLGDDVRVRSITDTGKVDELSIKGILELAGRAKLLVRQVV